MSLLGELSSQNLILLGLALVVGIWVLVRVARTLFKVIGIALVAGLVFFFWQGGHPEQLGAAGQDALLSPVPLADFLIKNCASGDSSLRCQCVTQVVYADLQARLTPDEQEAVNADPDAMRAAIRESLRRQRSQIGRCIREAKGPDVSQGLRRLWEALEPQL